MNIIGSSLIGAAVLCLGPAVIVLLLPPDRGVLSRHIALHRALVLLHVVAGVMLSVFAIRQHAAERSVAHYFEATRPVAVEAEGYEGLARVPDGPVSAPLLPDSGPAIAGAETTPTSKTETTVPVGQIQTVGAVHESLGLPAGRSLRGLQSTFASVTRKASPFVVGGAGLMLAWFLISYVRLRRHEAELRNGALVNKIGGTVVYRSPLISMPFSAGIVSGRVYLPSDAPASVLAHELCHVKHADLAWTAVEHLLRVIFWFSPFIHAAARRGRLLREMRADRFAMQSVSGERYIDTLLEFAASHTVPPFASAFALPISSHRTLRHRVQRLLRKTAIPVSRVVAALGAGVLLSIAVSACVGIRPDQSFMNLPLEIYLEEQLDDEGRAVHFLGYDGESGEKRVEAEINYFLGGAGQQMRRTRFLKADGTTLTTVDSPYDPPNTMPSANHLVTGWTYRGETSLEGFPWLKEELHDEQGRVTRVYVVDYASVTNHDVNTILVPRHTVSFLYRRDGSILSKSVATSPPGYRDSSRVDVYDADGRRIESSSFDRDGTLLSRSEYSYDDLGRRVLSIDRDAAGSVVSAGVTRYSRRNVRRTAVYGRMDAHGSLNSIPAFGSEDGEWSRDVDFSSGGTDILMTPEHKDAIEDEQHLELLGLILRDIVDAMADVVAEYESFTQQVQAAFGPDTPPAQGKVNLTVRASSDDVVVIRKSTTAGVINPLESRLQALAANRLTRNGEFSRLLRDLGVPELEYLISLDLELSVDPATGHHAVLYPRSALRFLGDSEELQVAMPLGYDTAIITNLLAAAPEELLGGEHRTAVLTITILPDGTIADPVLLYNRPGYPSSELERKLISALWGHRLPPTGLTTDEVATLLIGPPLSSREGEVAEGYSALSTGNLNLTPWLEELHAMNEALE